MSSTSRLPFDHLGAGDDPLLDALADRVASRETDPYTAADELIDAMDAPAT